MAALRLCSRGTPAKFADSSLARSGCSKRGWRRHDPERYEQYRHAGYIEGGADPSPVVVTFTTEIAAVAVNELLHRLTGFRGLDGHCAERVRRSIGSRTQTLFQAANGILNARFAHCGSTMGVET